MNGIQNFQKNKIIIKSHKKESGKSQIKGQKATTRKMPKYTRALQSSNFMPGKITHINITTIFSLLFDLLLR